MNETSAEMEIISLMPCSTAVTSSHLLAGKSLIIHGAAWAMKPPGNRDHKEFTYFSTAEKEVGGEKDLKDETHSSYPPGFRIKDLLLKNPSNLILP